MIPPLEVFIIIGLFIWAIRAYRPAQVEEDDYKLSNHTTAPNLTKKELNV